MEIIIGFLIALAITLTGSGAGTITAPIMMLFLGISPEVAVGTTLIFSLIVKIPVGISYTLKRQVDKNLLVLMIIGGIPGIFIGSYLLKSLTHNTELKSIVLGIVGIIILFSATLNLIFMLRKGNEVKHKSKLRNLIPIFTFFIGLEVGFSSAGAGVLGTLLLMYTTNLVPRQIIGTDILFGLILSAVGGSIFLAMGNVNFDLLVKLLAGAALGIPLGILGASKIPAKPLKLGLLLWILFIGTQLVYHSLQS